MNQPIGYIVIPDVHGHYDTLVAMLELLEKRNLLSNRKLVFLGDYVDRGPKIPDTLSLCVELKKSGHIFLMGNHDYWLVEIFQQKMEGKKSLRWAYKYGVPILQQYFHFLSRRLPRNRDELYYDTCEKIRQIIPPQHREFIESCQMYFETETMLCIHAGINYEEDWEKQKQTLDQHDLKIDPMPMQIKSHEFALSEYNPFSNKVIITGHYPMDENDIIRRNRVRLCGGIEYDELARLHAWVSDTGELLTIHRTA